MRYGKILRGFRETPRLENTTHSRKINFPCREPCPPCRESTLHRRKNYLTSLDLVIHCCKNAALSHENLSLCRDFLTIWNGSWLASSHGVPVNVESCGYCHEIFRQLWMLTVSFLAKFVVRRRELSPSWGDILARTVCHILLSREDLLGFTRHDVFVMRFSCQMELLASFFCHEVL